MKTKILIITESIDVEDSSGTKGRVSLIYNLQKAGFDLKILHYTRRPVELEGITCIPIVEKKWNLHFLLSRVQRRIQKTFKVNLSKKLENKYGFSFTFLNDVKSMIAAIRLEKDFKPDLILTLSKAASFRPHYALVQLPNLHKKWMAYVHDPFPFHFYPKPYDWMMPGAKQKEAFFREVANKAAFSAFPSKLLQEWMGQFFPAFLETGVVIPHQLHEEEIEEIYSPIYFNSNVFNILHAGALLKQRPPDCLISGFVKFLENNPEAKNKSRLLLIGSNSYHLENLKKLSNQIPQLFVSDGYIAYKEVRWLQEKVDVNVILEAKAEVSPFLPGKFPHCVFANKTILHLGPKKSEVRRLLGEDYRYCTETDEVEKIAVLLEELFQKWKRDPNELQLDRNDLKHYLSTEHLKKIMNSVFKENSQ